MNKTNQAAAVLAVLSLSLVLSGCSIGKKDEQGTIVVETQGTQAMEIQGIKPGNPADTYEQIDTAEAVKRMETESGYIILDVRTPEEFASGHIPGAINVPNESIGSGEIDQLPDKQQLIFVYCRSGNRSKQASEKLVKLGYTDIVEFGGINSWTGETEK